jgi:aromatic ring-opening dioxygenase catalytic subunit (LigB family)
MILLDDCPARHFMVEYGASLERPDAILMISAH